MTKNKKCRCPACESRRKFKHYQKGQMKEKDSDNALLKMYKEKEEFDDGRNVR